MESSSLLPVASSLPTLTAPVQAGYLITAVFRCLLIADDSRLLCVLCVELNMLKLHGDKFVVRISPQVPHTITRQHQPQQQQQQHSDVKDEKGLPLSKPAAESSNVTTTPQPVNSLHRIYFTYFYSAQQLQSGAVESSPQWRSIMQHNALTQHIGTHLQRMFRRRLTPQQIRLCWERIMVRSRSSTNSRVLTRRMTDCV